MSNENVDVFVESLLKTNRGYDFYVNWDNVADYKKYLIELHAMDVLIKAENFKERFFQLLKALPRVVQIFPLILAISKVEREKLEKGKSSLEIVDYSENIEYMYSFDYKNLNEKSIEEYYLFFVKTGLKNLFDNFLEKSVMDYVVGVLVGLDSNGRKNRSGSIFESRCEYIIRDICSKYGVSVMTQKQFKILEKYKIDISEDIANRKADFILLKGDKILNIEVNFYFNSGSKPEEIVDSYINRDNDLKENGIYFSLITDGYNCWGNESKHQLNKAFRHISIMNYNMAKNGYLEGRIREVFQL